MVLIPQRKSSEGGQGGELRSSSPLSVAAAALSRLLFQCLHADNPRNPLNDDDAIIPSARTEYYNPWDDDLARSWDSNRVQRETALVDKISVYDDNFTGLFRRKIVLWDS